jgi:hypothetical protein
MPLIPLPPDPREESATEAFARIEQRLALVQRVLESLAAERQADEAPDYGPTLDHMAGALADMDSRLERIEHAPAMTITPEAMAARIAKAAETARADDRATIREWVDATSKHIRALHWAADNAHGARQRQEKLYRWLSAGGGALAGLLVAVVLFYLAAWIMPERMATWTLGKPDKWEAGTRLMQAGNPESWQTLTDAVRIMQDNREAIRTCWQSATKTGKPAKCAITIDSPRT